MADLSLVFFGMSFGVWCFGMSSLRNYKKQPNGLDLEIGLSSFLFLSLMMQFIFNFS